MITLEFCPYCQVAPKILRKGTLTTASQVACNQCGWGIEAKEEITGQSWNESAREKVKKLISEGYYGTEFESKFGTFSTPELARQPNNAA